ncbi:hypothetical protein [Lunatibacter salilacus]|uniref:hypothetical protein n=1 Tax=Lunatibacter salilacus TaxID=2483804 RepID=UPI00131EACF1|nr:hypothetical protein [Lunatibacter salilacus]
MQVLSSPLHTFHIPVMGLGFTVDSPLKVAKYGISSCVSIIDDFLLEDMRKLYSENLEISYKEIPDTEPDVKAKRTTAYLNFLNAQVETQVAGLRQQDFELDREINVYFELLPENHPLFLLYMKMLESDGSEKKQLQEKLRMAIEPGSIDVNIMTKVDKLNYDTDGKELPREYSDALAALRGYAQSDLDSAVIFSAGLNPALYAYMEQFADFFPDSTGHIKKRVVLKVSDYRSALIQGKFLAKKGIWVSEFRVESGLNCGGHAFATEGYLMGPILEEFKRNRQVLAQTLAESCQQVLSDKGLAALPTDIQPKITYQGGLGDAQEDKFVREYYALDGTGWGSPFLLVPEATSVDEDTIQRLINARKSDFYLSHSSPLGVPFNNLRTSSGEEQRKARIQKNRPGSPCYKKFLSFSKEFSDIPICTASRQYQHLKLKQQESGEVTAEEVAKVLEKDCLCEGLSASAILRQGTNPRRNLNAVTICPGPNLAYFKGVFSLKEMVDHIYGKINLNLDPERPHVFVKEVQLYVDYLKNEMANALPEKTQKVEAYYDRFRKNLTEGIHYYQNLVETMKPDAEEVLDKMKKQLNLLKGEIQQLTLTV